MSRSYQSGSIATSQEVWPPLLMQSFSKKQGSRDAFNSQVLTDREASFYLILDSYLGSKPPGLHKRQGNLLNNVAESYDLRPLGYIFSLLKEFKKLFSF